MDILKEDRFRQQFIFVWEQLAQKMYEIAEQHGFHEGPFNDGESLALIHSEISECLEGLRHGNPADNHVPEMSSAEVELADAVIRILHYARRKNFHIADAILNKAIYNQSREYKHGKKF